MQSQHQRDPRLPRARSARDAARGLWILVVVGLLLVVLLLSPVLEIAFPGSAGMRLIAPARGIGGSGAVTPGRIASAPDSLLGQTVTVSGEVRRQLGPHAFTIGGEGFVDSEELLVVTGSASGQPRTGTFLPQENDIVQVTGTVYRFDPRAFERELGLTLSDARLASMSGRPAIVARSLAVTMRIPVVDVDRLVEAPQAFTGRVIQVGGRVESLLTEHAFTLRGESTHSPREVLIIADEPLPLIQWLATVGGGASVVVTGTVRTVSAAALEQVLGFGPTGGRYEHGRGHIVVVAQTVSARLVARR
jgi:hypothetical protein